MLIAGLFAIIPIALLVYMTLWFVFGFLYLKRIDVVDISWGIGFIYVAVISYFTFGVTGLAPFLGLLFVVAWGLRLAIHIGSRLVKKSEDPRYKIYRNKWSKNLTFNVYTRIFLLQGLLIALISTASIGVIIGEEFNSAVAGIGFAVWAFGIIYESIADYQLRKFVKTKKPGQIMNKGLWRLSRHPNYFGEITVWIGAAIVACSAGNFWAIIGPLVITFLILKVSGLPPIEKRYKDNPDYQKYKQKTPALIPFSVKK